MSGTSADPPVMGGASGAKRLFWRNAANFESTEETSGTVSRSLVRPYRLDSLAPGTAHCYRTLRASSIEHRTILAGGP